jgi:hypothetical protein
VLLQPTGATARRQGNKIDRIGRLRFVYETVTNFVACLDMGYVIMAVVIWFLLPSFLCSFT